MPQSRDLSERPKLSVQFLFLLIAPVSQVRPHFDVAHPVTMAWSFRGLRIFNSLVALFQLVTGAAIIYLSRNGIKLPFYVVR